MRLAGLGLVILGFTALGCLVGVMLEDGFHWFPFTHSLLVFGIIGMGSYMFIKEVKK